MQVVWFKRDLRVEDHRALAAAASRGPVLPLWVAEPELWAQPDMAGRHWAFVAECLAELRRDLAALGQPLVVRRGEILEVLGTVRRAHGLTALWSHQETATAGPSNATGGWRRGAARGASPGPSCRTTACAGAAARARAWPGAGTA